MVAQHPIGSPSFRQVAKGILELHYLLLEGKEDSPEADAIRDALDPQWEALSPTETERAQWLSEDLYSISDPPATSIQAMGSEAQQQFLNAMEARNRGEWDRALTLLRQPKNYIVPAILSYLRGSIWLQAGHPDIAAVFFGHASELAPDDAKCRVHYLHALAESDPNAAQEQARQVLANEEVHSPAVIALAASIHFHTTRAATDTRSLQLYRDLVPILERNMHRIDTDAKTENRELAHTMTAGLLGFCHELLGLPSVAETYYSRGLQADPNHNLLLVARGILRYGLSSQAIADLQKAVELKASVISAYLVLAHHYLATSRFEDCRELCQTGIRIEGSDTAKSQLEEWLAISQAELGFPPALVRGAFESALRLDPSNESARRNLETFEASLRDPASERHWEKRSVASVKPFALAERRFSFAA